MSNTEVPSTAPQDRSVEPAPFDRFTKDVAGHAMTVLLNDGLYRHLRFRRPETWCMGFDLVTWPGHLCYTGDMGTYVFSRLPDMFQFFRGRTDGRVDFSYWAEKCHGRDRDGIKEYREELFQSAVKADYDSFVEQEALTPEEAASLWQKIEDSVLPSGESPHEAVDAAVRFRWSRDGQTRGHEVFTDFWEHRLEDYTGRFTWCCYALRWAIATYDAAKVGDTAKVGGHDPVEPPKATDTPVTTSKN